MEKTQRLCLFKPQALHRLPSPSLPCLSLFLSLDISLPCLVRSRPNTFSLFKLSLSLSPNILEFGTFLYWTPPFLSIWINQWCRNNNARNLKKKISISCSIGLHLMVLIVKRLKLYGLWFWIWIFDLFIFISWLWKQKKNWTFIPLNFCLLICSWTKARL